MAFVTTIVRSSFVFFSIHWRVLFTLNITLASALAILTLGVLWSLESTTAKFLSPLMFDDEQDIAASSGSAPRSQNSPPGSWGKSCLSMTVIMLCSSLVRRLHTSSWSCSWTLARESQHLSLSTSWLNTVLPSNILTGSAFQVFILGGHILPDDTGGSSAEWVGLPQLHLSKVCRKYCTAVPGIVAESWGHWSKRLQRNAEACSAVGQPSRSISGCHLQWEIKLTHSGTEYWIDFRPTWAYCLVNLSLEERLSCLQCHHLQHCWKSYHKPLKVPVCSSPLLFHKAWSLLEPMFSCRLLLRLHSLHVWRHQEDAHHI